MNRSAYVLLAVLATACPEQMVVPPPPNPPQVFLTVTESNVIGDAVKGKVNVSGCKKVAQVQLLQGDSFLADVNYTGGATDFSLPPGTFSALYSRLGIAASLTLKAKVLCDDARTNTSQPVGVKFFPIERRFTAMNGGQLVTDNFIAEGGIGGTPNTFLGCGLTDTGTALIRVNTAGDVVAFNDQLPFDCSLATQISDRSTVTGTRWVLEPDQGVFAMNSALQIQRIFRSPKTKRMGVGPKGSVVVWVDEGGTRNRVIKMDPLPASTNEWEAEFIGIMNSTPVIDDGAGGAVWVTRWVFDIGTKIADIVPYKYNLNTGQILNGIVNGLPAVLYRQQYPVNSASQPIMPEGVFSADGAFFTLPVISLDAQTTTVVSCSTTTGGCETDATARRWTSTQFPGILRAIVPFSQGNIYAIIGPFSVYFLSSQLGTVQNLGDRPLQPTGSLVVVGVQPGLGTDFYVLTGPDLGANQSFAQEIIATEAPGSGELWRMEFGSGEASSAAMYMGIDDAQKVWIRAGTDLIKPLSNFDYRMARGPTVLP